MVYVSDSPRLLVSIVINNFNYGRFLSAAIESALAQSYSPLEVLVVDDGSTDDSREVVARYGSRVRSVFKPNGGQASAFNAGFAEARGSVVIFLDADDALFAAAAETAAGLFEDGVTKVHWPLYEIDAAGERTGTIHPRSPIAQGDLRSLAIERGPMTGNSPPTSGNAWSRTFLEAVLPIPEEPFRINADGYLLTLAWAYGEVRSAPKPLGVYRVHGANHFGSKPENERLSIHRERFDYLCDALELHLTAMGVPADAAVWKLQKDLYSPRFAIDAMAKLDARIPAGESFVLVDEDAWPAWYGDSGQADRHAFPFLEQDGMYWGRPSVDEEAIETLERLRSEGAAYIVFPWFTRWWLESYPSFATHISERFDVVMDDDHLLIFDLKAGRKK